MKKLIGIAMLAVAGVAMAQETETNGWRLALGASYRTFGDVDFDAVKDVAGALTPVPGGTGPMTNSMLAHNVLVAAQRQTRFGARLAARVDPLRFRTPVGAPTVSRTMPSGA